MSEPQKQLVIHSNAGRDKMPPTPTQLVTKGRYVLLLGQSVSLTFLGMSSYLIGIVLLLVMVG
ncbi:MAG: hypothetical protein JWN14_4165, partial [Chthonomonadales bacterium]|nr:hypothetical protein [Chthonomonadales bacterium]